MAYVVLPWGHKESDMTERLLLSGFPDSSAGKNLPAVQKTPV